MRTFREHSKPVIFLFPFGNRNVSNSISSQFFPSVLFRLQRVKTENTIHANAPLTRGKELYFAQATKWWVTNLPLCSLYAPHWTPRVTWVPVQYREQTLLSAWLTLAVRSTINRGTAFVVIKGTMRALPKSDLVPLGNYNCPIAGGRCNTSNLWVNLGSKFGKGKIIKQAR